MPQRTVNHMVPAVFYSPADWESHIKPMDKLSDKIKNMTKRLRSAYYRLSSIQGEKDDIPFGGSIRESIAPFPEFILKGRFCRRSVQGYCSPCFYSRLPKHDLSDYKFDTGYIEQVDHILKHFVEYVVKNQAGKVAPIVQNGKTLLGMVCTPTGSHFDADEYPLGTRKIILQKLLDKTRENNYEIALHIESHAEDVMGYFKNPDAEEISLLKIRNFTCPCTLFE